MIEAKGLTMHYGSVVALEDASFSVGRGEIVGYLGPNGAGKSTTLKILTTYLYPTHGTATIGGKDIRRDPIAVRRMIGYLPEVLPLYVDMEVSAYLKFVGRSRGLRGADLARRLAWVQEKAGLAPVYRRMIRELSKGYKQRTALAQALIHDPEVIIMDEPTSGLDPHQILEVRKLITELAQEKTLIVSTHILQEIESICSRAIIINRGRIVADGNLDQLARQVQEGTRVEVAVRAHRDEVAAALRGVKPARKVEFLGQKKDVVRFDVEGPRDADLGGPVYEALKRSAWEIRELKNKPFTLEETFLALTEAEAPAVRKGGVA